MLFSVYHIKLPLNIIISQANHKISETQKKNLQNVQNDYLFVEIVFIAKVEVKI